MGFILDTLAGPTWGAMISLFICFVGFPAVVIFDLVHRRLKSRYRPEIRDFVLLVWIQKYLLDAGLRTGILSPHTIPDLAGPAPKGTTHDRY